MIAEWIDQASLTAKRLLVCSWRGHDEVTVIDGVDPGRMTIVPDKGVMLAATIRSTHRYCLRCRRRTPSA